MNRNSLMFYFFILSATPTLLQNIWTIKGLGQLREHLNEP